MTDWQRKAHVLVSGDRAATDRKSRVLRRASDLHRSRRVVSRGLRHWYEYSKRIRKSGVRTVVKWFAVPQLIPDL